MICEPNELGPSMQFDDPVRGHQIGRIVLSEGLCITRVGVMAESLITAHVPVLFQITMDAPRPPVWVECGALKPYPESPIEQPGK